MTSQAPTPASPCGSYTGTPLCQPRNDRRFYQCPVCGGWVDSTDPRQLAEHEAQPAPIEVAQPTLIAS